MFSMQFAIATEMLSSTLTRLGSQPITFSKLPGKFIISRITSLGSSTAQIEWKNFTFYARDLNSTHWWGGLNDSIIIQDRFHLLCWSKMMHRAELIFSLVFLKDWKEVLGFVVQALIEVNSIAINCLVIKLAGHPLRIDHEDWLCCHFFSFKPFFKFRVLLPKKVFLSF